jgi:hypothetical protein
MLWRVSADTHRQRIGIMFKFLPATALPGFRVGLPEDVPGFNIDNNGLPRRGFVDSSSQGTPPMGSVWENPIGPTNWIAYKFGEDSARPSVSDMLAAISRSKREECLDKCLHLLPSPSGDLQSSEFRKCYRECIGTL